MSVLTIVVSAMEPKLLMNILQETLTGGPSHRERGDDSSVQLKYKS